MFKKINFKNTTENLGITIIAVLVGVFIGYTISVRTSKTLLKEMLPTIERAIDKESIKNEIKNEISIDKVKKSDSLKIILSPTNNQEPTNIIIQKDSLEKEKRSWIGRILSGKKYKQ